MMNLLAHRGYRVELAEDGDACLQIAQSFAPDLILLDIMLPKMHGVDVLKKLKENGQTRGIGVIVCTAKNFKADLDQVRTLGAADIIFKPFEKDVFLQTVEHFFGGVPELKPEESTRAAAAVEPYRPHIPAVSNFVRFWGTRGSIPVSGARFVRHGGNTSCVVAGRGDEAVVIDAGSGIRDLGLDLVKAGVRKIHLFITHTHWDHIQGFPFFVPLYVPGITVIIYGASTFGKDLNSVFRGQLDRDYFPVQFEDMRAHVEFRMLDQGAVQIGGLKITWEFTHHPAATVGFKIETAGKSVAYVSDNEFLQSYLGSPHLITTDHPALLPHQKLLAFLTGVDLLIHEAQYTNDEYPKKIGWGHSSLSNACLLTALTKAKRWIITHHDPMHDDEFLEVKLNLTKEILRTLNCSVEVTHAYDGRVDYF